MEVGDMDEPHGHASTLCDVLAAFLVVLAGWVGAYAEVAELTPREKAALLVVSSPPAPGGVVGVLVHYWETDDARPQGALVFVDQEGGPVRAYRDLPPESAAADYDDATQAFEAGQRTAIALRRMGVDVDLAPVLDSPDGPLGSRHFRTSEIGIGFARGLAAGGVAACPKHFPGLGSTSVSTDGRRPVRGVVRAKEVAGFRAAARAGVRCVMVSHAIYPRFGKRPASLEPEAYALLRSTGFEGVAITDELGVLGSAGAPEWARRAVLAGADLVLFSSARDARRAIDALVPLAREGLLDEHVRRVLQFRERAG
jgi:beta-N-acetylhexosaminidase